MRTHMQIRSISYTTVRMLDRDNFKQQFETNRPVAMHEFVYPIVQAGDNAADARL